MAHQVSPAPQSVGPPAPSLIEIGAALATGGLLTLMILFNGTMAAHTTPLFASFTAHGVGTIAAGLALAINRWRRGLRTSSRPEKVVCPSGSISGVFPVR